MTFFKTPKFWMLTALAGLLTFASCKKKDNNTTPPVTPPSTITDIVSASPNYTILKAAVIKAGLATTLSGTGPFTVFAPSDSAFTAAGVTLNTVNTLTADQLKTILLYHTLSGEVKAANVPAGPNAPVVSAEGDSLYLTNNSNGQSIHQHSNR